MTYTFKVGDKVRCVRGISNGPVEGTDYIISEVFYYGLGNRVLVNIEGIRTPPIGGWFADRFVLETGPEDDLYV